jgi:hypothetical protein
VNAAQRRLLFWSLVVAAMAMHAWNGDWCFTHSFITLRVFDSFGWDGDATAGLLLPAAFLAAAAFVWFGGRSTAR